MPESGVWLKVGEQSMQYRVDCADGSAVLVQATQVPKCALAGTTEELLDARTLDAGVLLVGEQLLPGCGTVASKPLLLGEDVVALSRLDGGWSVTRELANRTF
ncbi:MAG: hypothetical protein QM723_31720 [Myxococcaceae bacterium]